MGTANYDFTYPTQKDNPLEARLFLDEIDLALFGVAPPGSVALADPGGNGFVDRTSLGITAARTLTGTANQIAITNGGGGGNPVFSIPSSAQLSIAKITNLTGNGFVKTSGSDGTLSIDTNTYLANPMTTLGDIIRGATAGAPQRLAVGSAGQVLTVVSGEPAWATPAALGGDLAAIEALTGTGFAKRTGADTWVLATPSATDVGLGNVTNDVQTKASIVPNTLPSSGQILVGNAGGTAYAPVSVSGDVTISNAGVTAIGALKVTNAMLAGSIDHAKLAAMTSADLRGIISDENGTGALLFNSATSPTFLVSLTVPQVNFPSGGIINFSSSDVTVTHATNALAFAGASSGYSFIGGDVGIGTALPLKMLHVGAGSDTPDTSIDGIYIANNGNAALAIRDCTNDIEYQVAIVVGTLAGVLMGSVTDHPVVMRTNAAEVMRWTSTGKVGIGTSNPLSKLSINGGLHVGGDSDAGDNNLLVDGNGTFVGDVTASSVGIRSTGAAFDLIIASSEVLTADRTLSIVLNDAARTLTISGNATVSGTNTGDQTITLTGNVTGSGTGSFATTIAAGVVTNAMLAGSIAASKLIGTDIATVGTITAGTWQGAVVGSTYGGTGINNDGRTLTIGTNSGTLTFPGAATVMTFPSTSATIARTDAANTFTGNQTFAGNILAALPDTSEIGSATALFKKGWISELDSVLFAEATISVLGGWLMVAKGEGKIAEDVDTSETEIDFGTNNIVANDFILFRGAGAVEYMQATSLVSGTTWNVTRNVDGSGANEWVQGSVYVNLGYNGTGRIELNANSTPRISMITQGTAYNSQTELLRIGDLNGGWGYSSTEYGFAVGDYAAGNYVTVDDGGMAIKTGGGGVTLDANGIAISAGASVNNKVTWKSSGSTVGDIWSDGVSGLQGMILKSYGLATSDLSYISISPKNSGAIGPDFSLYVGGSTHGFAPNRGYALLGTGDGGITFDGLTIANLPVPGLPAALLDLDYEDAATNTFADIAIFRHGSSVTPAASFGGSLLFKLDSSTTNNRDAVRIGALWGDATDATRTSAFVLQLVNNAGSLAEAWRTTPAAFSPGTADGLALGAASLPWSDLHLAEGGVINWDNGDVTLTQTGNELVMAGGNLQVNGNFKLGPVSTGVVPGFFAKDLAANFSIFGVYPQSGTNVNMSMQVFPKGTGQANNKAQFSVFGTDGVADATNIEFMTVRATGASYLIASGLGGTGVLYPIILSAGGGSASPTNANQLRIETTGNVKIAGSATRATTEGSNHLDIFNGTAPAGTLSNGISIYSAAGECWIMDAAGNTTQQSPHDKETGEWIYFSRNTLTGKVLRIEMEQLMKAVNKKLGTDFIQEYVEKAVTS